MATTSLKKTDLPMKLQQRLKALERDIEAYLGQEGPKPGDVLVGRRFKLVISHVRPVAELDCDGGFEIQAQRLNSKGKFIGSYCPANGKEVFFECDSTWKGTDCEPFIREHGSGAPFRVVGQHVNYDLEYKA
jgi:hypothetical protein